MDHQYADSHELEPTTRRRRRRRGLLIFLLAASSVATLGGSLLSLALFTDSDASTGGFTTGTIDIESSPAVAFSVPSMMPGDTVTADLEVRNDGTAELRYAMTSSSTNADGKGLRSQLTLTIDEGTCAAPGAEVYSGSLVGASFGSVATGGDPGDRVLSALTPEDFCFTVGLPDTVGNAYQGATTDTTFTFAAEQTANN